MRYIATFYTHFAAQQFYRKLVQAKIDNAKMKPVPRELSASCGVCVEVETNVDILPMVCDETEGIYLLTPNGYEILFSQE